MFIASRRSAYLAAHSLASTYSRKANYVSWSNLASAFNTKPTETAYLEIFTNPKGIFDYRQLIDHVGLLGMKYKALEEKDRLLAECLSDHRSRKLVQIFDDLSDALCKIADLSEFLRIMHPDQDMMFTAQNICVELSQIVEELNTNKDLYSRLKHVAENGDSFPMSAMDKHTINLFLFDFEQCGIHLPEKDRQLVVKYNDAILQLGHKFMQNAVQPRIISKKMVPSTMVQYFRDHDNENILVTGYAEIADEFAREQAYRIFVAGNPTQEKLLDDILLYRQKLAQKCNFPTYAHRATKDSTAGTPEFVIEFLDSLNRDLQVYVKNDFDLLRSVKATNSKQPVAMWDVSYLIGKVKKDSMEISAADFRPYFSLGACMDGLNFLTQQLFGITLENEDLAPGESWVEDSHKIKVIHESEGVLGVIYCDFFERQDKTAQDCHFTIKGGRRLPDRTYQNPVVVVVLNLPMPTRSTPSLLTPNMVENLFHEMGHALHSMLGRTEYQHITGTRCATDFAEVPSILMEYFATDPRVLKSFAKHYKTGKPIPDTLLQRLHGSKKICSAAELQSQILYSAIDHVYHTNESVIGRTTEVLAETHAKYYPIPYVENTAWQLNFSHLIGYGAKYYSYLMSRSIASSIWQMYFKKDPFERIMGEKYRAECLAFGGGKPPKKLVRDYLQIDEVTPAVLTKSLVNEIQSNYKEVS